MTRLCVYALLTALLFGCFVAEGTEKTFSNDEVMKMMQRTQNDIATLQNKIANLESDNQMAKNEIATLKSENKKAQNEIATFKYDNQMAKSEIATLKFNHQKAQNEIATLKSDNQMAKKEIMTLKSDNLNAQNRIVDLEAALDQATNWMNDRQMDADSVFLATISASSIPVDSGDPIIWDSAPINPGGHFSTVLGAYEAPVNGYYQFSVTKMGNNFWGSFFFLVDTERYAYQEEYEDADPTPAGSATINIELTAGQIVRVENSGSNTVYGTTGGYMNSWFTGHLLYAL